MPIKGMFNQKAQRKNHVEWEKQILRINTLEVQMKGLLRFEKEIRTSMFSNSSREEQVTIKDKEPQIKKNDHDQKFNNIYKSLDEIRQRVFRLENFAEEKGMLKGQRKMEEHEQLAKAFSTQKQGGEKADLLKQMEMRVQLLEHNLLLVNEVQAELLKRMDELTEKSIELTKQLAETEVSMNDTEPILKTLYIDKVYLEKYEQNNNFAQLGIKSLSGALNIGATYGKEVIPKEITDQVKEDFAKIKSMKEDMASSPSNTDQSEYFQQDESFTEVAFYPSEEDIPYTEIEIEDDDSTFE